MTVSPTCSEDGFFINSDFDFEYDWISVYKNNYDANIIYATRSFKMSYIEAAKGLRVMGEFQTCRLSFCISYP
jgi:hypothetical protein